jgi:hypothetical protein
MSVSVARLERWLETDPDRLERYLGRHPEAADLLDAATALPARVRVALVEALEIPEGLAARLLAGVAGQGDAGLGTTVLDLFGSGLATLRILSGWDQAEPPTPRP